MNGLTLLDILEPLQADLIDMNDCENVPVNGDPFTAVAIEELIPVVKTNPISELPFDKTLIEASVKKWAERCKTIKPMLYSLGEVLPRDVGVKWLDIMRDHGKLDDDILLKKVYFKALLISHPDKQKKDPEHIARAECISRYLTQAYKEYTR